MDDPILEIRKAVAKGLKACGVMIYDEKEITDSIVDSLPDFFRQRLQAAEPTDEDRGLKSFGESMANYQSANLRQ